MLIFSVFVALIFFYSLASQRLERTVLTAPMLFMAFGVLTACSPEALTEMALDRKDLLLIAELGLVMTLFTDAARVQPHMLKGETNLPVRLLGTGCCSPLRSVCWPQSRCSVRCRGGKQAFSLRFSLRPMRGSAR
jgi:sodium/hydrogen antiporter